MFPACFIPACLQQDTAACVCQSSPALPNIWISLQLGIRLDDAETFKTPLAAA